MNGLIKIVYKTCTVYCVLQFSTYPIKGILLNIFLLPDNSRRRYCLFSFRRRYAFEQRKLYIDRKKLSIGSFRLRTITAVYICMHICFRLPVD